MTILQHNDVHFLRKVMKQEEKATSVGLAIIFMLLVAGALQGCSSSTGWRVSFGVAPVSQIRDVASLQGTQSDTRIVKRQPAPKTGATAEDDY